MSDVFISYARSTASQAQQVAEALRALGYGVWRDDDLPAHRAYAEVIEEMATVLETTVAALVGEDGKPIDPAVLTHLAREGAMKLLGVYAKIEKAEQRRALITLANALAARSASQERKRA